MFDGARARVARRWVVSLALLTPSILFYAVGHYGCLRSGTSDAQPTGFVKYDMPYYMAVAREHYDQGSSCPLLFSNPFSYSYDSPAIHFQGHLALAGAIWRFTGLAPGTVFVIMGLIAGLLCMRAALALYEEVIGLDGLYRRLGLVLFCWGGGVLSVAGIAIEAVTHPGSFDAVLRGGMRLLDPFSGWWFLNLGRNTLLPPETILHAGFLWTLVLVLRRKLRAAMGLVLLISLSHAFTGAGLLAALCSWALFEWLFLEEKEPPRWFAIGLMGVGAVFVTYNALFLPSFPEARVVAEQWHLPWTYHLSSQIPAYALVAVPAIYRFRTLSVAKGFFADSRNRLLVIWALTAFILANHEFAVAEPTQPLHFTRGYVWMPLFLAGAPEIIHFMEWLRSRFGRLLGSALLVAAVGLFLSDNVLWYAAQTVRTDQVGVMVTPEDRGLMEWLDRPENAGRVLVTDTSDLSYMAAVYTGLRSWYSHMYITPYASDRNREIRRFYASGSVPPAWENLPLLVVLPDSGGSDGMLEWLRRQGASVGYRSERYVVMRVH